MANWAIEIFFSGIVCSGHNMACKKWNTTFVTVNNDFWALMMHFANDFHWSLANDFHSWLRHSWESLANRLTRDKKNRYSRL